MPRAELKAYSSFAESLAREAGKRLQTHFAKVVGERRKGPRGRDILTDADTLTQKFIFRSIRKCLPQHGVFGEESGSLDDAVEGSRFTWMVDPLDGTINFAAGLPWWCVALALVNVKREPVVGVIYDPLLDELFSAHKGGGAYLNGSRIHVTRRPLNESIVAVAVSHHAVRARRALEFISLIHPKVRRVRFFGSSSLDLASTAAGRFGACTNFSSAEWDVLAGQLLVTEAGGLFTGPHGETTLREDTGFLAGAPHIHRALAPVLRKV